MSLAHGLLQTLAIDGTHDRIKTELIQLAEVEELDEIDSSFARLAFRDKGLGTLQGFGHLRLSQFCSYASVFQKLNETLVFPSVDGFRHRRNLAGNQPAS